MPTALAEPTLQELLDAFEDGIRASKDRYVDAREGAVYQHWGGVAAILWTREARRDTDLWRAVYLDSAEGPELTKLLFDRYTFERIADTYGVGKAVLTRTSTAAGAGSVWQGTRIAVLGATKPRFYIVSAKKDVGATETRVEVDIRADRTGSGVATRVTTSDEHGIRIDDPLWDATWTVEWLECADGTSFESAPSARARLREHRRDQRVGFIESIIKAAKEAGAANVLLFPSNYAGDADDVDIGLNMAYVGDAGFTGSEALVRSVMFKLEGYRVLGDNLQVRPLSVVNLIVQARVRLWDGPGSVNQDELKRLLTGAVLGYFDGETNGFSYQRDALAGAMMRSLPNIETIEFDAPSSDAGVLTTTYGRLNFPTTLSRYRLTPADVTLSLLPAA